jgi:hypothetical protein
MFLHQAGCFLGVLMDFKSPRSVRQELVAPVIRLALAALIRVMRSNPNTRCTCPITIWRRPR